MPIILYITCLDLCLARSVPIILYITPHQSAPLPCGVKTFLAPKTSLADTLNKGRSQREIASCQDLAGHKVSDIEKDCKMLLTSSANGLYYYHESSSVFIFQEIFLMKTLQTSILNLPLPTYSNPRPIIPSIVTRTQVAKILPLLRNDTDRLGVVEAFVQFNGLTAPEQHMLSKGLGDDFFEIGLDDGGCIVIVSIYRMDDDAIYLRIDPDCALVIREITL